MKSIRLQVEDLYGSLYELIHLGDRDFYVNMEDIVRLNKEIRAGIEMLYPVKVSDIDEEAILCAVLLRAYSELMFQESQDDQRRQSLLDRSSRLLEKVSSPLLKCRLLVCCYGEVAEPGLAEEAHAIMDTWQDRELSVEEQELVDLLQVLEDCQL